MALQQWLMPGENIHYRGGNVYTAGKSYQLFITSERLLFYASQGAFFPKDAIISERLTDISTMSYSEQGLFKKQGRLVVYFRHKVLEVFGTPESLNAAWQTLQHYTKHNAPDPARVSYYPPPTPAYYQKPVVATQSSAGCLAGIFVGLVLMVAFFFFMLLVGLASY